VQARELLNGKIGELNAFKEEEQALLATKKSAESRKRFALVEGLLADLRDCLADMRDEQQFHSYGSKKMAWVSNAYGKQRALGGTTSSQNSLFGNSQQQTSAVQAQTFSMAQAMAPPQAQQAGRSFVGGNQQNATPMRIQQQNVTNRALQMHHNIPTQMMQQQNMQGGMWMQQGWQPVQTMQHQQAVQQQRSWTVR